MIARRRRLGIPKVNPNPQVPGMQQGPYSGGPLGMRKPGHAGDHGGGMAGPPGGRGGSGQGHGNDYSQDPGKPTVPPPKPPVPPKPQGIFDIPNFAPVKGQADPRDQTYYTNVARLLAAARQGYAQSLQQTAYANTDYARSQQNLALQQQQDQRNLAASALRSGLSSSGYLNRATTEQTGQYLLKGGDLSTSKYRADAQQQALRDALVQGFPLDVSSEYASAADRFAQLQAQQAQEGDPVFTRHDIRAIRRQLNKRRHGKGRHGR